MRENTTNTWFTGAVRPEKADDRAAFDREGDAVAGDGNVRVRVVSTRRPPRCPSWHHRVRQRHLPLSGLCVDGRELDCRADALSPVFGADGAALARHRHEYEPRATPEWIGRRLGAEILEPRRAQLFQHPLPSRCREEHPAAHLPRPDCLESTAGQGHQERGVRAGRVASAGGRLRDTVPRAPDFVAVHTNS